MRATFTLRAALVGVLLTLLASACGGGEDTAADTSPTPDPAEGFQIHLDDEDDGFQLPPLDPDAVAFATDELDLDGVGSTRPSPQPLDDVVIDQGVRPDEVGVLLDEGTALSCAHAEFALDALYAADAAALAEAIATAAEFGEASSDDGVKAAMADLADRADDDDVQDAVIAALRACAASGYEL